MAVELLIRRRIVRIHQPLASAAIVCTAAMAALAGPHTSSTAASFNVGRIYRPTENGTVYEHDTDLNVVGNFRVPGITGATGATFGAYDNLVFIGRRENTVKVMEVDSTGQTVRQYDTGVEALNAVSYIDYDPVTQRYAFANNTTVSILDRNLNLVGAVSGFAFNRVSGVAWGPDGGLYATDNLGAALVRFNANLEYASTIMFGPDTGLDIVGNVMYLTRSSGIMGTYNIETGAYAPLVSGAGFGGLVNVVALPSGNLLTCRTGGAGSLSVYSPSGTQLDFAFFPDAGDGLAYFVPTPATMIAFLLLGLIQPARRRS